MIAVSISTKVCNVVKHDFLAASQGNILKVTLVSLRFFLNQKSVASRASAKVLRKAHLDSKCEPQNCEILRTKFGMCFLPCQEHQVTRHLKDQVTVLFSFS
jgi:hypothetical protein